MRLHTIGCGLRITELSAESVDDAKAEAADFIGTNWQARHEGGIQKAKLLVVEDQIDLSDYLTEAARQREAAQQAKEAAKREQGELELLEQLAKKHGKTVHG